MFARCGACVDVTECNSPVVIKDAHYMCHTQGHIYFDTITHTYTYTYTHAHTHKRLHQCIITATDSEKMIVDLMPEYSACCHTYSIDEVLIVHSSMSIGCFLLPGRKGGGKGVVGCYDVVTTYD